MSNWIILCLGDTGTSFGCTQRAGHVGSCVTHSDPFLQALDVTP